MRQTPILWLLLGGFCLSWASILIKWCTLPALAIAAWRLTLAGLLMGLSPEARMPLRLAPWRVAVGSILLALHFATWIFSLKMLPVFLSVTLVTTSPLWVQLASGWLFREPIRLRDWVALSVAFAGTVLLSHPGPAALQGVHATGVALAVAGALCMAAYLLWARAHQPEASGVNYAWRVYSGAALLLMLAAGLSGTPLGGYPSTQWSLLLGLAVIPQVLGHTFLLRALRSGSATVASLTILLEPVGSIGLAALLLGERLAPSQGFGVLLTLGGLLLRAASPRGTSASDHADPQGPSPD